MKKINTPKFTLIFKLILLKTFRKRKWKKKRKKKKVTSHFLKKIEKVLSEKFKAPYS